MLGKNRDDRGVRRFAVTKGGQIEIDAQAWEWMFKQAAKGLKLDVDTTTIRPPNGFDIPTLVLWNREKTPVSVEMFEAIRKGARLTFNIVVLESSVNKTPTRHNVKAMLDYIGNYIGMSQYGSKFGFGRFTVESLNEL